jgi:hypothetical protein
MLALTLDLPVPPLSLLGIPVVGMFVAAALAAIFGHSPAALTVSTANLLAFLLAAFLEHGLVISAAAMFGGSEPIAGNPDEVRAHYSSTNRSK